MTRFALRSAAVTAFVVVGAAFASGSASAAPGDTTAYDQHVRQCAQMLCFDHRHNPGMHQGITTWDPNHTC